MGGTGDGPFLWAPQGMGLWEGSLRGFSDKNELLDYIEGSRRRSA